MEKLLEYIANRDPEGSLSQYNLLKTGLEPEQRQELLGQVIAFHYDEKDFEFFRQIMDMIIGEGLDLNFHIEHWAPSFLALAVHVVSENLFNYLLSKGADINFIGDPYAFEDDDYVRNELKLEDRGYATCLDFAEKKFSEMIGHDYHYQRPDWTGIEASWSEIEPSEEITISKRYYAYLLEQAQYLHDLVNLNRLINHIRKLGGRNYSELR